FIGIPAGYRFIKIDGGKNKPDGKKHHDRPYILPVFSPSIVDAVDQKQIAYNHTCIDQIKRYPCPFIIVYFYVRGAANHKISQTDHRQRRPSPEYRVGVYRP